MSDKNLSRRDFLKGASVAGISATAGCIDLSGNNKQTGEPFTHSSTRGFRDQPTLGPKPTTDKPTVVAFEDLSCPVCASFHNKTLQELKSKYIDSGELTFIFRGVDFVYPWGGTAALVQESVYENRQQRAFDVIESYYDNQSNFTQSNVLEESKKLLEQEGLDPNPIIQSMNNSEVKDNLDLDATVGKESNIRATPTFHLFVDGYQKTKIVGAKNISVFENVLNL